MRHQGTDTIDGDIVTGTGARLARMPLQDGDPAGSGVTG